MDDPSAPPPPVATPPRGSAVTLGLALLVAWALALVDGLVLVSGTELAPAPVLGVLLGLWTLVALIAGLLGHALAAYRVRHATASGETASGDTHPRPPTSGDTHPRAPWESALSAALVLWGALAVHRALIALEDRSTDTLLVATITLLLLGTPIALAVRHGAERLIVRHLEGASPLRTRLACASLVIPALLGLLGSLWAHHPDFFTELATHEPWGDALALLLPMTLGLLVAARATGSRRLGWVSLQRRLGAHSRRLPVIALTLSLLGLLMGVLGARGLQPADARALRTRSLYSGTLVRAGLRVGVPAPALDTAVGLRACTPGAVLAAPGSLGSVGSDAPDILLITIDGLRFDHTSLAPDSPHANTPRLLEHASRAAVFTRAYTPAPSTRAAFRSIFTGLLPGQLPAPPEPRFPWAMTLAPGQPTLGAYLEAAGYHTVALVSKPKAFPVSTHALTGFSEVDDTPTAYQTRYHHSAQLKVSRIIGHLAEPPGADRAPRFVWTHFIEPHFPFTRGATVDPLPGGGRHEARHDLSVRFIDEQLDRLLRFAQAPERRDRTIVIITSDHGEAFGEHQNSRHGATVYEEEIHVPLLVFGPGIVAGTHTTPVSLVELLPTILELAGLSPATGVCGTGWAAALRSGAEPTPQPVYVAALPDGTTRYHQLAFLLGDEKLIVDGGTGQQQRFQLASDPREQRPDEGSVRVASLRDALDAFLRERGLPTPP